MISNFFFLFLFFLTKARQGFFLFPPSLEPSSHGQPRAAFSYVEVPLPSSAQQLIIRRNIEFPFFPPPHAGRRLEQDLPALRETLFSEDLFHARVFGSGRYFSSYKKLFYDVNTEQ